MHDSCMCNSIQLFSRYVPNYTSSLLTDTQFLQYFHINAKSICIINPSDTPIEIPH